MHVLSFLRLSTRSQGSQSTLVIYIRISHKLCFLIPIYFFKIHSQKNYLKSKMVMNQSGRLLILTHYLVGRLKPLPR